MTWKEIENQFSKQNIVYLKCLSKILTFDYIFFSASSFLSSDEERENVSIVFFQEKKVE